MRQVWRPNSGAPPMEFRRLQNVLRTGRLSADLLHKQIQGFLTANINRNLATAAEWFDLLFFHSGKTVKKASLILEIADWSQFAYPANHAAVQSWMNDQLQLAATSQQLTFGAAASADAYANPATGTEETLPGGASTGVRKRNSPRYVERVPLSTAVRHCRF